MLELKFILSPLLKIIGFDYKNKRAKDRVLLEQFLEFLSPDSDTIRMLKSTDMGDSIPRNYFTPLYHLQRWRDSDKEFQVRKIEQLKISFIAAVEQFLNEYSKQCKNDNNGNLNIGITDLENPREEILDYQSNLNKLANSSFKKYDRFVRYARKEI